MRNLVPILLLALACSEGEADDETTGDGGTSCPTGTEPVDCGSLTAEECAEHEACAPYRARPVEETDTGWCVDNESGWRNVGCREVGATDCGSATVIGTTEDRPDECLWWFPEICLPPGFIVCPAGYDAPICP